MIKGITVKLHTKEKVGNDPFGAPIYSDDIVEVDNVLVSPKNNTAETDILNLNGRIAAYELGIPKGDNHEWEDTIVEFFGEKFHTIGTVVQGIEELVPTPWHKKVSVERHE